MRAGAQPHTNKHIPVRTCAGCRAQAPQSALVRVALEGGRPQVDLRRRLPGRGAYVHSNAVCVERATKRGGLARALRIPADPVSFADLRRTIPYRLQPENSGSCSPVDAGTHGRRDTEKRQFDGLTPAGPRFVVGTPQPKGQR